MGEDSISRRLTREFTRRWRLVNPRGQVISRDLAATHIPVIDAAWVAANYTPVESRNQQQNDPLALSTELSGELLDADEYVIGVPMHNWGPSASLKLWADQIVRFGRTTLLTPAGLKALDKKRAGRDDADDVEVRAVHVRLGAHCVVARAHTLTATAGGNGDRGPVIALSRPLASSAASGPR